MAKKIETTVDAVEVIRNRRIALSRPEGAATTGRVAPAVDVMARLAQVKRAAKRRAAKQVAERHWFAIEIRRSGRIIVRSRALAVSPRTAVLKVLGAKCKTLRTAVTCRVELDEYEGVARGTAEMVAGTFYGSRGGEGWSVRNADEHDGL